MQNKIKQKKISKARLYRSVASSSAIETHQTTEEIERKLKNPKKTFNGVCLKLAL
jgi:hypothetical protein